MNLIEEYQNALDKQEYFQQLSTEEKLNLYKNMTINERRTLLSTMPFQYIKDFILTYSIQDQHEIYKNLNDNQLKAIYNTFNEQEKQNMIKALETYQIKLDNIVSSSRSAIQSSTANIETSKQSIENSNININLNKEEIKNKKQELKAGKVTLKKLNRERKRNLRKVMHAKKKLNGRLSRISIISKYRTNKYLEKINALEQTDMLIDSEKINNAQIKQEINDLKANIEKEKTNIEKQQQTIKEEQQNINRNISRIGRTENKIRNLSKSEKKLLGRKLYNQVVLERDCIIVRKKKEKQQLTENNQPKEEQQIIDKKEQQVKRIVPEQTEVVDNKQVSTENMVNNMINNANKLQGMGCNFYPPANIISNTQSQELLQSPVMQITPQQLILVSYTMMAVYNYAMQQMLQQQQAQNLSNGYNRTLSKGFVNLTFLASIIFFLVGILLYLTH